MPDSGLSTAVNQHYLNKVMDLTDAMEVQATEDIFDARGNKLLAKGARVSRGLQERLIVHKLKKPLEACILVAGGVDADAVLRTAQKIADTSHPVAHILGATHRGGTSPLAVLAHLKFGSAMSMMLTISEREGSQALEHAVMVSLLSIGIAKKAGLPEQDQAIAGMAGLLHDIGELYIDPTYLMRGKRLLPHEWAHLVIHPHTGQMLINELEAFPDAVGRAVAEHHERFDGSGYPRRSTGPAISSAGQIVSIAETIAAVLLKDRPLERAALALRIIPGEHSRPLLAAISSALGGAASKPFEVVPDNGQTVEEDVRRLVQRISMSLAMAEQTLTGPAPKSAKASELLTSTISRIRNVQRAIVSTGLDMFIEAPASMADAADCAIMFEREVATREIQWRLRDIARDLSLQSASPDDRLLFLPLVHVLDDDFSGASYGLAKEPRDGSGAIPPPFPAQALDNALASLPVAA